MWKTYIVFYFLFIIVIPAFAQVNSPAINDEIKLANEYYARGDVEKAKKLYADIAKDPRRVSIIHNNYYFLLLSTKDFNVAEKYINRQIRQFPSALEYRLDLGLLYHYAGKGADKYFKKVIGEIAGNTHFIRIAANYFINQQLLTYAQLAFEESRKALDKPMLYGLEMANLYRLLDERPLMVKEYLNYLTSNPSNIKYVKNTLQNLLTETKDLESLEVALFERVQQFPENPIYPELLIWVNLQLKNFYGAFVQARALDRRMRSEGDQSMEVGIIALDNGDFTNATKIFNHIIENYPRTGNYIKARMYLIRAYEMRVKNTYPINDEEIKNVIANYDKLVSEMGIDQQTLEAMRNKALLYAFYLDQRDSAIRILEKIVNIPRANLRIKSQSKLDLGDIYLLNGEHWESTLLYSQVEKEMKETPIGYEAKLRNAKLSYFKGDFLLAQERLDIIKQATTREIANDAIGLSLLIKDNIALDSTEAAMRAYAAIELLLFQNKTEAALAGIEKMKTEFSYHSLTDELLWMEADISIKAGQFEDALDHLQQIVDVYGSDILGDDAYFLMGEIWERHLNDKDKAMEVFFDFITRYPGSVYSAESRKRYRALRGDFKEDAMMN
ncbi:MAG: tetratricopeptide repeat protein [Cyclobacteriaceae bacterium]|nr:tetratricopeptide repeat protein [Cyclobacteriaceae bacterium]